MRRLTWKRSDVVHRPPEELFELSISRLLDPKNVPSVVSMEVSEGPVGTGTTIQWSTSYKDTLASDTAVITEFEPPRRVSMHYTRRVLPAPGSTSTRRYGTTETATTTIYEPVAGGTRRTASAEVWSPDVSTVWHSLYMLAHGNFYRKQFHKSTDALLDLAEGPSLRRKAMSFVRQVWSGWIPFWLVFVGLLWVHASHAQLGLSGSMLQVVRVTIGLMVVLALIGAYFMASFRDSA
ncbi:MAG TPA: hypothetical protein VEY08_07350 [Chloroflexia bacterium]|nr:hypothetical protein [Chloroflexia bacterium]